jgi:hypothetical protein
LRVLSQLQKRIFVVGNGNIDVGNKTPTREPGQPVVVCLAQSDGSAVPGMDSSNSLKSERPGICGAMSQQRGDSGNVSAPQKLVHLVGCRDPKTRREPWVRPRPGPIKP